MTAMRLYLGFTILLQHFYYIDLLFFARATGASSVAPPVATPVAQPVAQPVAPPMVPPYGQNAAYPPQYFPQPGNPQGYPPPMGYPAPPQLAGYPPMASPPQPPLAGYPPMGYPPQPQPQGYPPAGYPGIPGYSGSPGNPGNPPEPVKELPQYPPGATRSRKHHHGRQMPKGSKTRLPHVSCPQFFAYQTNDSMGWYGYVALPLFSDEDDINLEVNMTVKRKVLPENNLKIKLLSSKDELVRGEYVRWAVTFPYQDSLPRLVQIKYNGHIICSQVPDRSRKGSSVTNMWAKSVVEIAQKTGDPAPAYYYRGRRKSENWFQSVLKDVGANFKGYVQTGYQGSYGPLHSEGQAAVDAFASANMNTGVKTGVYGKGGANVAIGDLGVTGDISGHAESNWNKEGGTIDGSVSGNLGKYVPPPLAPKPKVEKAHTKTPL